MCDPVTATVMSVASAGVQYKGQQAAAKAQRIQQARASEMERKRYLAEVGSMRLQQRQEEVVKAQKIQDIRKRAMEARATAKVSAGESGVAGLSIDALINDFTRQEAQSTFSLDQQSTLTNQARDRHLEAAGLGFTNNMLRINKPIQEADLFGSLIQGASTGMNLASTGKDMGFTMPWAK